MKNKPNKSAFTGTLEHRDGKKIPQHGGKFSHKTREAGEHSS